MAENAVPAIDGVAAGWRHLVAGFQVGNVPSGAPKPRACTLAETHSRSAFQRPRSGAAHSRSSGGVPPSLMSHSCPAVLLFPSAKPPALLPCCVLRSFWATLSCLPLRTPAGIQPCPGALRLLEQLQLCLGSRQALERERGLRSKACTLPSFARMHSPLGEKKKAEMCALLAPCTFMRM